jgi:hypothetical protein
MFSGPFHYRGGSISITLIQAIVLLREPAAEFGLNQGEHLFQLRESL